MSAKQAQALRELFIDELAQVHGGGPVEDVIRILKGEDHTTMACCEEGPDGCCSGQ